MKRILALVALAPLLVATTDGATPAPACGTDAGRETLTAEGFSYEFLAPAVAAPELSATHEVTGDLVRPHRTASFPLVLDIAPSPAATVAATLSWEHPSDYDLYLIGIRNGAEYVVASSIGSNIDEQTTQEGFITKVADCAPLRLEVRNWAGSPAQMLSLDVSVTPVEPAADGVAPRDDTRTTLFLAGDRPGQAGTIKYGSLGSEEVPVTTAFTADRPRDNTPNQYTRAVVGSDIERNPLQPFWTGTLDGDVILDGQASAVVWLSSQTQAHDPGTVKVSLFVNGKESSVELDGALLGRDPAPFHVTFPDVFAATRARNVTFQVTTLPVVSPNAASEHRGDAQHTVWYDSVQYQSAVHLPTTAG